MSESIFTTQTPASTDEFDGGSGLTLCTLFTPAVDGTVPGIRWFGPVTTQATAPIGLLYSRTSDASGSELARATFSVQPAGTWGTVMFASPVAVTAGQYYYASVWTRNRFAVSGAFFTSAGVTNGNLTAPQTNAGIPRLNGRFAAGGSPTYPDSSFNANWYGVDVLFDASGPADVPGVLTANLGSMTAALTGTRSVAGAGAAGLGSLTAAMTGVRQVIGVASASLGGLSASMAGSRQVSGVLAATLGPLTASMVTVRAVGPGTPIAAQTTTAQVVSQTTARTFTSQTRGGVL